MVRRMFAASLFFLMTISPFSVALDVFAQGLFNGGAILVINGKRTMLKAGKRSTEGVLLIESNPKEAVVEIDGLRKTLTLSRRISSEYNEPVKTEVAIRRNEVNQFITSASINGFRGKVLVDTGANTVAMSSEHARKIGLDYKKGRAGTVATASGIVNAYSLNLQTVIVGGIQVNTVMAFVIEGSYPETILLGMTYLKHVNMREQDGILYLQEKY
ncbi:MAG: aspartyl protease family protein [Gammaproteobacteria bacterium]|jgi:aspartyl protease family protein